MEVICPQGPKANDIIVHIKHQQSPLLKKDKLHYRFTLYRVFLYILYEGDSKLGSKQFTNKHPYK